MIKICGIQFQANMSIADTYYEVGESDPFGYARQARQFRQAEHPLDGFNIDLPEDTYKHLKT